MTRARFAPPGRRPAAWSLGRIALALFALMACGLGVVRADDPPASPAQQSPPPVAAVVEEGFQPLFDGKSLSGWQGDVEGYAADDGVLFAKPGTGGNLYTVGQYDNFVLRFEFRLTPGANNGIALRAPLGQNAAYQGMEIQVLDDGHDKYKGIHDYQVHGSVYGVVPAERGHLLPTGEWNREEIRVEGSHVTVTLNGHVIVDADVAQKSTPKTVDGQDHPGLARTTGHLGFCGHGDQVDYRNLRVKPLPPTATPTSPATRETPAPTTP